MESVPRLDEIYRMTSYIYSEQNAQRPASATFAHFVEVCGILSMHVRKKKREEVTFKDALCKALGWYFPLMAKFKVRSVEELIYRKYPYVCPYCREAPHVDSKCKTVHGTKRTLDHSALRQKYVDNKNLRPHGIRKWQQMFDKIYPRTLDDAARSVVGLFEELGEIAEAVRVFDRYPKYFAGEAADVFSYLMGLANEYSLQRELEDKEAFDLESEFLRRYPGLCMQCGYQVCACPLVPDSTVGRMAKELEIKDTHELFATDFEEFRAESIRISEAALERVGGFTGLATAFPFDRGETNRQFVLFCLDLADRIGNDEIAARLRSAALKAGTAIARAGSRQQPLLLKEILAPVQSVLDENRSTVADALGIRKQDLPSQIGNLVIGEYIAGDKIVSEIAIKQGSGTQIIGSQFVEGWNNLKSSVDLKLLAKELAQIKDYCEQSIHGAEGGSTKEQIRVAEEAAKQGNGPKALMALAAAGKVALEFAVHTGAILAAEVIRTAIRM